MPSEDNRNKKHSDKKNRKKSVITLTLFLAVFVAYSVLATHFLGHACPVSLLFGVPCPGCGLTRAWLLVFHGDFAGAFSMHPLFWSVPIIGALFLLGFFSEKFASSRLATVLSLCGIVLFLGVYVYRMVRFFPGEEPIAYNTRSLLFWLRSLLQNLVSR